MTSATRIPAHRSRRERDPAVVRGAVDLHEWLRALRICVRRPERTRYIRSRTLLLAARGWPVGTPTQRPNQIRRTIEGKFCGRHFPNKLHNTLCNLGENSTPTLNPQPFP